MRYEFILIGERDKFVLANDEITPDYPYATHWLLRRFLGGFFSNKDFSLFKK